MRHGEKARGTRRGSLRVARGPLPLSEGHGTPPFLSGGPAAELRAKFLRAPESP